MTDREAALARLDAYVAERISAYNTPGLALAVTDRGRVVHAAAWGYADLTTQAAAQPATRFAAGSIGKAFTAVALLREVDAGRLDLHAPVARYLPWFRAGRAKTPITIHHLLTHTAGLVAGRDATPSALSEIWALRATTPTPPGRHFYYSDTGYKILGLMLEEVTGRPYGAAMQAAVLDPLDLAATAPILTHAERARMATGYVPATDDRPSSRHGPLVAASWLESDTADGSLVTTVGDLAGFVRFLLNGGNGPHGPLLQPAGFAQLAGALVAVDDVSAYGYGLYTRQVDGWPLLYHGGDIPGYQGLIIADPAAGFGVALLLNGPGRPYAMGRYALALLRAAQHGADLPLPPLSNDPARIPDAAAYAGTYRAGDRNLTLRAEGERLVLHAAEGTVPLESRSPDAFYADHPAFHRFLFQVMREGEQVVGLAHGADWYQAGDQPGRDPASVPAEWLAYPGHYRAHNPWLSNFRVVLRQGALVLVYPEGDEEPLLPAGQARFRVGQEPHTPERLCFDPIVQGAAQRATLSGAAYYRFFTP